MLTHTHTHAHTHTHTHRYTCRNRAGLDPHSANVTHGWIMDSAACWDKCLMVHLQLCYNGWWLAIYSHTHTHTHVHICVLYDHTSNKSLISLFLFIPVGCNNILLSSLITEIQGCTARNSYAVQTITARNTSCQTGCKQIHSSAEAKLFGGKTQGENVLIVKLLCKTAGV